VSLIACLLAGLDRFCKRAKGLLESLNIEFHAVELDQHANGRGIQAALLDLTGQRTVPNIWINGNVRSLACST